MNTKQKEPTGELVFDHIEIKDRANLAVYAKIYLKDEAGQIWMFEAASFRFDLKESI